MPKEQPTTMDDLMNEFEFEVDAVQTPEETQGITIDMGTEEEKFKKEIPNTEESKEEEGSEGDASSKKDLEVKTEESNTVTEEELEEAADNAKKGNNSGYKNIALKYIEKGTWSEDLAVEDAEGNIVPVSELEDIDEDTFFQIEEAVKAKAKEDNKNKFISIEGIDERRKNILDIVAEGGDLTEIFNSSEEVEDYINPFSKLDLDNEAVQERVYLNALIKYNKLDADVAQTVVDKAKKDLTLDTKVKTYVDQYTANFDKYVISKKEEIIKSKQEELKTQAAFKKSLREQYKSFDLKPALANRLADSAVNKKDGEFEIDTVYAQKMESPEEAAELILFLTDKKAYLDFKMKDKTIEQHKKTRQTIKLIPREKVASSKTEEDTKNKNNEFEFEVPPLN